MAWQYPSILLLKRNEVEDGVVMREKQGKQSTVSTDQLVRYLQRFTTQYDAANCCNAQVKKLQNPCRFVHEGT
jgi:hypothetical protein